MRWLPLSLVFALWYWMLASGQLLVALVPTLAFGILSYLLEKERIQRKHLWYLAWGIFWLGGLSFFWLNYPFRMVSEIGFYLSLGLLLLLVFTLFLAWDSIGWLTTWSLVIWLSLMMSGHRDGMLDFPRFFTDYLLLEGVEVGPWFYVLGMFVFACTLLLVSQSYKRSSMGWFFVALVLILLSLSFLPWGAKVSLKAEGNQQAQYQNILAVALFDPPLNREVDEVFFRDEGDLGEERVFPDVPFKEEALYSHQVRLGYLREDPWGLGLRQTVSLRPLRGRSHFKQVIENKARLTSRDWSFWAENFRSLAPYQRGKLKDLPWLKWVEELPGYRPAFQDRSEQFLALLKTYAWLEEQGEWDSAQEGLGQEPSAELKGGALYWSELAVKVAQGFGFEARVQRGWVVPIDEEGQEQSLVIRTSHESVWVELELAEDLWLPLTIRPQFYEFSQSSVSSDDYEIRLVQSLQEFEEVQGEGNLAGPGGLEVGEKVQKSRLFQISLVCFFLFVLWFARIFWGWYWWWSLGDAGDLSSLVVRNYALTFYLSERLGYLRHEGESRESFALRIETKLSGGRRVVLHQMELSLGQGEHWTSEEYQRNFYDVVYQYVRSRGWRMIYDWCWPWRTSGSDRRSRDAEIT